MPNELITFELTKEMQYPKVPLFKIGDVMKDNVRQELFGGKEKYSCIIKVEGKPGEYTLTMRPVSRLKWVRSIQVLFIKLIF